jgi:hypothetical protein
MVFTEIGYLSTGQFQVFGPYQLIPDTKFIALLYFTGDIDLYGRFNAAPTTSVYDAIRNFGSGLESLFFDSIDFDEIYLGVNGWSAGSYYLSVDLGYDSAPPGELDSAKIFFHLRQVGISFTEDILDRDFSDSEISLINQIVAKCEVAFNNLSLESGSLIEVSRQETQRDISSTVGSVTTNYGDLLKIQSVRPSYRERIRDYHLQVEKLAIALGLL